MNKLWLKISFRFLLLLFFVLLAIGFFIGDLMKNTYMDMTRNQLFQDANIVSEFINSKEIRKQSNELQEKVESFYAENQPRITIIDVNGDVVADSEDNPAKMENHANRPEFKDIVKRHKKNAESIRFSETLGYNMMYVATPIQNKDQVVGVIRVAFTLQNIDHAIKKLWLSLGLAMGITLILASIIAISLAKGITRPIEDIIQVARRLSEKDYSSRVRAKTNGELEQLSIAINTLAKSLQHQMEEISENQQKLTGVLTNMVSGVMLINPEGRIVLVNPAMEKIIGSTADQLRGKLHIEAGKSFGLSQLIDQSLKKKIKIHDEVQMYYPDQRILDAHLAPYLGANGEIKGIITVLHDITDIRRLEKMRSEFVANVSHELKTPITSLKGFAETLLDGAMYDPEIAKSFLTIIHDESERLHRLITDILHLSKIEQHQLPFHPEPLNVTGVIYETIDTIQEEINKKQLTIKLPNQKPVIIDAEKDRLQQIILNLVANAVTYTPDKGTIEIGIVEKDDQIELTVKDTGIGISKEELPRIFERFYRVDKARSRNSGGTGLGLAIVKHLVESHHGSIQVDSEEGKGTLFTITLPKKQNR
ncbi:two-component system histidine kinase PnpS [Heyndrickxia sporothermodurans]|uniref:histidine kinase n=1 Tax=Heyndrickxia sporothermodurans TaxID=46224 RepID=A0AB37H5I9_9BACI|nr:ATP-binding protein [Heyndrickxia sporothermodurans]MBL5766731.1 PAS domain S-box protein [Heyndrickxia sporothermodurans]MBL5770358.1 PAS domain S-box protein [Heyndrickxia sporothermodurans]MBL5774036.1 PAS domain S-box protein [Heyndrickxia sporothermodurans]MBL5780931.1 PAS domain S-box protein [Heyndrickxia sporothermodurans]MBL5784539.1 PAS domain S-box protein [Heyndrickxia sporothermodurans]